MIVELGKLVTPITGPLTCDFIVVYDKGGWNRVEALELDPE